ncbi:Uncharacterised protein [Oligella ureolytica]|uniref:hypothetical protein n=1 Tax=Oligella ureolytica TaxID=90244 RepID=UPI000E07D470|nr:hypothetical protein [Oligella ureolytica]SUA58512.1 Uncharacterised protein [Oligella ureolytica]
MPLDTFLQDFERTEHSDSLHAIFGRALIIATRFDAMCVVASLHKELKVKSVDAKSSEDLMILIKSISKKYQTLAESIKKLDLPDSVHEVLSEARKARNSIVHDLAKGMTGCLDNSINEISFVQQVSELVTKVAYGDLVISYVISSLNKEPSLKGNSLLSYVDNIVQWVVEK